MLFLIHLAKCINREWMFSILEDAIDDWPTTNTTKKNVENNMTTNDDSINVNEDLDIEKSKIEEINLSDNEIEISDNEEFDSNDYFDENEKENDFEDHLNLSEEIEQQDLNEESNLKRVTPKLRDIEDF